MDSQQIIINTEEFVKEKLAGEGTGHDWWHCIRVRNVAVLIAQKEGSDMFVVELASLLHDIADHKFYNGDVTIGPKIAREWLEKNDIDNKIIDHVVNIISYMSWGQSHDGNNEFDSLEMRIVQDADRLDALGAIGVARAFAYGGYKKTPLYNPTEDLSSEYKGDDNPSTIHHFYEKILKIAALMNTSYGKELAKSRHEYVEKYLEEFFNEWNGKV